MSTERQIARFIEEELLDGRRLKGDPLASGSLDSLGVETLIAFLTDQFGISFGDEDVVAENFSSLTALAALVDAKRSAERATGTAG